MGVIHRVKRSWQFPDLTLSLQVLRGRTLNSPDHVEAYNREVTNNWKLLSRGKLELTREYMEPLHM